MLEWLVLLSVGVCAGTLGGVIGFGSTVLLMPPLVWFYGPIETVPIIAITAGMANLSRAAVVGVIAMLQAYVFPGVIPIPPLK